VRRFAIPAVAVALVAGLIAFEALSASSSGTPKPAPPLPSAVLQAPRATLASLRGKPALINFWASWCDPCRKEAPELARLDRSLHGAANLVGVDYTDEAGAAREFIHRYGWTFPVLADPNGVYGARFKFSGLPTTVVLDSRGRIAATLRGPQTEAGLRRALSSVS
jgi:cytochrome c biogenesis protein CcmG/thiol:disulfide interchange protein DsbE